MRIEFINQILNNFLKVSKFTIKLNKLTDNINTFFSLPQQSQIEILIEQKPQPPYMVFTNTKILKMIPYTKIKKILIDSKEIFLDEAIILAGMIDIKQKTMTEAQMMRQLNYPALSYFYSEFKKDKKLLALSMYKAGLELEAIKILQELQDDEMSKIILAKIYREKNNLRKSLEIVSNIQSKELEPERNIEYAWLHLKTSKPQNSIKIFEYYKNLNNIYLRQDVLLGLAISISELYPERITESIKILEEAEKLEGFSKEDIMKKLASIYIELKDSLSALKIYNQIYDLTANITLIPTIFELAKKNNQNIQILHELAIFMPDEAKKLAEGIKLPPNTNIQEEETKSDIVESILIPEDITKTSKRQQEVIRDLYVDLNSKIDLSQNLSGDIIETKAFEFIKLLEAEFSKKIYFNLDGIDDIERKVRITTMSEIRENEIIDILTQASYFLLYLIRERFKAKINIYEGLDIWTANAIIKNKNGLELLTYPAARIWKFKWESPPPQHGYIRQYINYINSFMGIEEEPPYGKIAIKQRVKSNEQKIFDAQIEHRKILEITRDLEETSYISPNSSLLIKFEKELRKYFKPNIPPTIDGWKILRCFGHIFLEMILKDFSPTWYCVERNDGLWSFELPNKTYIFPVGKVYKAALTGESLEEYYTTLRKNIKLR
ncbi:MAG: hypothetical protein N2Z20_03185 [Elusimicrobiales bacterium]|nr:hypothetical protein [Elusimicrobiales bacterium]